MNFRWAKLNSAPWVWQVVTQQQQLTTQRYRGFQRKGFEKRAKNMNLIDWRLWFCKDVRQRAQVFISLSKLIKALQFGHKCSTVTMLSWIQQGRQQQQQIQKLMLAFFTTLVLVLTNFLQLGHLTSIGNFSESMIEIFLFCFDTLRFDEKSCYSWKFNFCFHFFCSGNDWWRLITLILKWIFFCFVG